MVWEGLEGFGEVREGPAYVRTVQGTSVLAVAAAVEINETLVPPQPPRVQLLGSYIRYLGLGTYA